MYRLLLNSGVNSKSKIVLQFWYDFGINKGKADFFGDSFMAAVRHLVTGNAYYLCCLIAPILIHLCRINSMAIYSSEALPSPNPALPRLSLQTSSHFPTWNWQH